MAWFCKQFDRNPAGSSEHVYYWTSNYRDLQFFTKKSSFKIAYQTYIDLISSKDIQILENNSISRIGTMSILQKYNHLSYTDANSVWHSQTTGIKEIMSFDQGFDDIENIIRVFWFFLHYIIAYSADYTKKCSVKNF